MPTRLSTYRKWKWAEKQGVPVADVVTYGGVSYCMVCPLCGCLHEMPGQHFDTIGQAVDYAPRCLLREYAQRGTAGGWQALYGDWLAMHPQAEQHTTVTAVYRGAGANIADYAGRAPSGPVLVNAPTKVKRPVAAETLRSPQSKAAQARKERAA